MAVDLLPLLGNIDKSPGAARAAMQAAEAYSNRSRGKWGNPAPMLGIFAKTSEDNALHIWNVGPWNDWARMGSWGDWFLPAKPDNDKTRYVYCCSVGGAYLEYGMKESGGVDTETIDGEYVAQCIVGEGSLLRGHNDDNRASNGVFIGSVRGPKGRTAPTEEDLEKAESRLIARYHQLVDEANDARALGGPNATLSINEKHHLAAKRINRMDLEWARDKNPTLSFKCPGCGDNLPETAVSCKCGRLIKPAEFWAEVQQGVRLYSGEIPEMYRISVAVRVTEPAPAKNGKPAAF